MPSHSEGMGTECRDTLETAKGGAGQIEAKWSKLASENPFEWVAATSEEIVATGRNLSDVIKAVAEEDLQGKVTYAFIRPPGPNLGEGDQRASDSAI